MHIYTSTQHIWYLQLDMITVSAISYEYRFTKRADGVSKKKFFLCSFKLYTVGG